MSQRFTGHSRISVWNHRSKLVYNLYIPSAALLIAGSEFPSSTAAVWRQIICRKSAETVKTKTERPSEEDNNIIVSWRCSGESQLSRRTKTTGKFAPGRPRWQSSVLFLFPVRRHRVYSVAENRETTRRR